MAKGLVVRKLADKTTGDRVKRWNPDTGESHLVNPETDQPEPWPLAGVRIEDHPDGEFEVPTSWVQRGRDEGWLTVPGERIERAPAGPPEDPWQRTHIFVCVDSFTIDTVDGPVTFDVVRQPGVYDDPGAADGRQVVFAYIVTRREG